MAQLVLTNAKVTINSVDLSDHVKSVTIDYSATLQDNTTMGSTGAVTRLGGLKDWSMSLDLNQDYAASSVDATLFPLVGTSFTVAVQAVNGSITTTNPNYTGTAFLESYQPIAGSVGDVAKTAIKLTGSGVLSRATT